MNLPTPQPEPRFPTVSRRAFLRRAALVGLTAAAVPAIAACGGGTTTDAAPAPNRPTASGGASTTPGTAPTSGAAAPTAGQAFSAGERLQVDFTYQASGSGRVDSPYIAVWIEDGAGDLVQTVSLWFKSDESKYLRDLKRWNSKDNRQAMTTGATRIPGSFSVAWDGSDLDGQRVSDGDYVVCIEAAREDGPYQIIRESVPINATLTPTTLAPSGELTAATVSLVA